MGRRVITMIIIVIVVIFIVIIVVVVAVFVEFVGVDSAIYEWSRRCRMWMVLLH